MKREHPKWGPRFDQYCEEFKSRLDKAFDNYTSSKETTSVAHDDLLPLSLLETMLTIGDNMHKLEYQHGEKSLTVLMATVRRYTELNKGGIFDYYYGYLCMRHITRTICIGTLIEAGIFEDFLKNLDPKLDRVEATEDLAKTTLEVMLQAFSKSDTSHLGMRLLGSNPPTWNAFLRVGGLNFKDVEFLTMILWNSRHRLMTLIEYGMVPGFSALLFTLCEITMLSRSPTPTKKWTQLNDMILRTYLAGTRNDQEMMRQLSNYAFGHIQDHNLVGDNTTNKKDARTVVRAYVKLFGPSWNHDDEPWRSIMMLDIANILFGFVSSLLVPSFEALIPKAGWGALERIWLEIDTESDGFMTAPQRGLTRFYAGEVFYGLSDMRRRLQTRRAQQAFSTMLTEIDPIGLVGRLLLMISREDNDPDTWDTFISDLGYLYGAMGGLQALTTAPERFFRSNVAEWIKVQNQLMLLYMGMVPSRVPNRHIIEAINCWASFRSTSTPEAPWKICSNPRCATVRVLTRPPDANHACGRCINAIYCSGRCQGTHWSLHTSESHIATCSSSDASLL